MVSAGFATRLAMPVAISISPVTSEPNAEPNHLAAPKIDFFVSPSPGSPSFFPISAHDCLNSSNDFTILSHSSPNPEPNDFAIPSI